MLEVLVPGGEFYNERTNEFIYTKDTKLVLEHSLASVSKWEAQWKKPFLSTHDKTRKETLSYIKCMTLNEVDDLVYSSLTGTQIKQINDYINDPMTATTISKGPNSGKPNRKIITSEVIYFQMATFQIPFETDRWHLNRLLMLIQVCAEENQTQKKMNPSQIAKQNRQLNAARRKAHHTRG